jgi:hypothetical protein
MVSVDESEKNWVISRKEIVMTSEDVSPTPYIVYLVRCWPVETDQGVVWRASAEDPHNNERRMFADLSALCRFLDERTTAVLDVSKNQSIRHKPEGE